MVFNATFNNRMEENGVHRKNLSQVTVKLYHIMLYLVHLAWAEFELTTLGVIGTDCIGSYKSTYHTIKTRMAPATIENITQNRNYREICDFYWWIIFTRTRSYDIWIHSFFNKPEAHLSLYLIIWWYVICCREYL
jgi:hypothetical protein